MLLVFKQLALGVPMLDPGVSAVGLLGVCCFLVAWWRRLSEECLVFLTAFYCISSAGSKSLLPCTPQKCNLNNF